MSQKEVKCPYGDYYAVLKVNTNGDAYTFLRDGTAKKDRFGKMKTGMPSLEAIMRRHEKNEWKMIVDWYWNTRNKLQDDFNQQQAGVQHADGTPTVAVPMNPAPAASNAEPYSALKALLGKVADPTDIQALLRAAGAVQGTPEPAPQPAPTPAPAPMPMPAPTPAPQPAPTPAAPAALGAIIDSWASALKQAEETGKSVPVTWNFNGRAISAYLRGIQGNSVYLTMHHMAKWKTPTGEHTAAVIPANVTEITAR